jgi:phosphoesterase RecJ-like protein
MSRKSTTAKAQRGVRVPAARRRQAKALIDALQEGSRVALTTHVNADGDGAGSEVALWHMLNHRGIRAAIANPTPFPDRFRFLLDGADGADKSRSAVKYLEQADAIIVLDIADIGRLGHLGNLVAATTKPVFCIDHHMSNGHLPPGPRMVDPAACATGELVYDLLQSVPCKITESMARAIYVAILTDTGGFRFSNTNPRVLQIAADLLAYGLHTEEIYKDVYASESEGKVRLIGEALETLIVEHDIGLAWLTVPPGSMDRLGVDASDLDGIVELPRSIRGVRLAILFRQLANGRVKASFRSVGDVDVAALAEQFGGGGHVKAAGASFDGPLAQAQETVLTAARKALAN